METMKTKQNCQGKCTFCDKENLDYKAIVLQDDFVYFPFTCDDCGTEGREYYAIQYSETDYFYTELLIKTK